MPFATEEDIRKEAFLDSFEEVSSERLQESLNKAHEEILTSTNLTDSSSVSPIVIRAEAILALSHLFRSTAISAGVSAKNIHTSGISVDEQAWVRNLLTLSLRLKEEAWTLLRTYLKNASLPTLYLVEGENL